MAVQKTTVYLDEDSYHTIKSLAKAKGRPPAELVREAVAEYAERATRPTPRSIGSGRSARGDVSTRVDELLKGGFGR